MNPNQKKWLELAYEVKSAYAKDNVKLANKGKLILVIEAFESVYKDRSTANEEHFYLSKLIGTGRIEGTLDEVLGTVNSAIQRSVLFISNEPQISCSQAEVFSTALVNCLDKEKFNSELDTTLAPYHSTLIDIAKGNV